MRCIKSNRECSGPVVGPIFRKQHVGSEGDTQFYSDGSRREKSAGSSTSANRRRRKKIIEGLNVGNGDNAAYIDRSSSIEEIERLKRLDHHADIPRKISLFPEYDLYNYCINIYLNWFSVVGHPLRFKGDESILSWSSSLPMFALSSSPSATTFAARALLISHCGIILRNKDIGLIGANWYVHALRQQKDFIGFMSQDSAGKRASSSGSSGSHSSAFGSLSSSISSPSAGSSLSDSPTYSSSVIDWASSDTPDVPMPARDSPLLPEHASFATISTPKLSNFNDIHSMRGNEMSFEDDAIVAGMLLAVYELFKFSSSGSWIKLLNGASELMRLRGPYAYRSGFNFAIFQSMRGMMALRAITSRERTFLNEPLWKSVPWQYSPKTIHHRLLDIIIEIPDFEDFFDKHFLYAFKDDPAGQQDQSTGHTVPQLRDCYQTRETWLNLQDISKRLDDIDRQLAEWLECYIPDAQDYFFRVRNLAKNTAEFDFKAGTFINAREVCRLSQTDDKRRSTHYFHPALDYATLHDARLITLFHSVKIVTSYLHQLIAPALFYDFDEFYGNHILNKQLEEEYRTKMQQVMIDSSSIIGRSFKYFLSRNSNAAIMSLLFPLGVDRTSLTNPYERGWIWAQLQAVHSRMKPSGAGQSSSAVDGLNGGFILKELDFHKCIKEWQLYKSLPVCEGCGEHLQSGLMVN